jgi:hypothetical protein
LSSFHRNTRLPLEKTMNIVQVEGDLFKNIVKGY